MCSGASSPHHRGPGDWVLDLFAGSGTTGKVARDLDRRFVLVDESPDAIDVMASRLGHDGVTYVAAAAA